MIFLPEVQSRQLYCLEISS